MKERSKGSQRAVKRQSKESQRTVKGQSTGSHRPVPYLARLHDCSDLFRATGTDVHWRRRLANITVGVRRCWTPPAPPAAQHCVTHLQPERDTAFVRGLAQRGDDGRLAVGAHALHLHDPLACAHPGIQTQHTHPSCCLCAGVMTLSSGGHTLTDVGRTPGPAAAAAAAAAWAEGRRSHQRGREGPPIRGAQRGRSRVLELKPRVDQHDAIGNGAEAV